jgi:aspartyl aminopeptidase
MNADVFNSGLLNFLDQSPSPFHATQRLASTLSDAGFSKTGSLSPSSENHTDKVFITRNDSSLIAIRSGSRPITESGIRIIGAHTDSPCLRIKPVEIYGGVLLAPWFDRDLSIAGRINAKTTNGLRVSRLIDFQRSIATIPSLAIHLNREVHKNRTINPQLELVPILCDLPDASGEGFLSIVCAQANSQYPDDAIENVSDFELYCYDTQPASRVGLHGDYLASARLDNLLSCFAGLRALVDADSDETIILVCNDHEEVGSVSAAGAQGPFLRQTLEALSGGGEHVARVLSKSRLISADNAHAVHPNYENKHDAEHKPVLNGGPVIKYNANQRYATTSTTAAMFRDLCANADVPVQSIAMRSDMGCGSTIGPITSAVIGIDTVDIGAPQLAMHSPRELTGWQDPFLLYRSLLAFFNAEAL